MDLNYKVKSVMLGHAVADALGVPVEFCDRAELDKEPVADMMGYGTYPYPAGCWSDDTSMSLAALDSLANGGVYLNEIMHNFGDWYYKDAYTPTGEMFDVGNTCSFAIDNYFRKNMSAFECGLCGERSNGNGSLMRIHPFVLYQYAKDEFDLEMTYRASALTHAHPISKIGCGIYAFVLWELLKDKPNRGSVNRGLNCARRHYIRTVEGRAYMDMLFMRIGGTERHFSDYGKYPMPTRDEIKSGGYVVHTLEAAVWCLLNTPSYRDCVLTAVNLGDDTDTVAAVAGGLAGALYGYDAIPKEWLETLKRRDYIEDMCDRACAAWV